MLKHCLLRGVLKDDGKRDDFIVTFSEHRPPVWWRRWKSSATPSKLGKTIVADGRGFNLPVPDDSQWVPGDLPSKRLPDLCWEALKDTNPSTVEYEGRFFADEGSVMKFILMSR